jgi:hypothetical protein
VGSAGHEVERADGQQLGQPAATGSQNAGAHELVRDQQRRPVDRAAEEAPIRPAPAVEMLEAGEGGTDARQRGDAPETAKP